MNWLIVNIDEPSYKGNNYLTIIKHLGTLSYAFRMYDNNCKWITEYIGEEIIAFTEDSPLDVSKKAIVQRIQDLEDDLEETIQEYEGTDEEKIEDKLKLVKQLSKVLFK